MTAQKPAPGQAARSSLAQLADDWDKLADENDNESIRSGEAEWAYRANELRSCAAALRTLAAQERPAPELATLLADWRKTADSLKGRRSAGDARERNTLEVVIGQVEAITARHAQPAPELPADPTADELAIASLGDEVTRLRERLAQVTASEAVTRAEVQDLRKRLDERNRQHKALLDGFELIRWLEEGRRCAAVAVLDDTVLARAYRDAGYPVRDDLSHLAQP